MLEIELTVLSKTSQRNENPQDNSCAPESGLSSRGIFHYPLFCVSDFTSYQCMFTFEIKPIVFVIEFCREEKETAKGVWKKRGEYRKTGFVER